MLEKFYADVLPQTGYFCLFNKETKQHIWAESHAELATLTRQLQDHEGIYFATASYQSAFARKQVNVRALRALRLDIDVAKPKGVSYPTKKVALAAVINFVKESQLVPTYIISSGKGFHLYWCLDKDCAPADWIPMAEGLQRRGVAAGLLIDSTCTIDTARILRPPGTVHHDDVRVTIAQGNGPIWNVADLRGRLVSGEAEIPVIPADLTPTRSYDMSVNEDVRIEIVRRPPVSAIEVAGKCAALHYVASVGGDVPEPYWRAMLGLVKHTIEGEDLAHEWSMGHPQYDEDETQEKLDRWSAGPTTCAEFENHTTLCGQCPYRGQVRSPVLLVNPPLPASEPTVAAPAPASVAASPAGPAPLPPPPPVATRPWESHLPEGFVVKARVPGPGYQMIQMKIDDEDPDTGAPTAKPVPFASTVFWMGHWADAQGDDVARVQVYKLDPSGTTVSFTLDQDVLASRNKLVEFLGGQGIHITNNAGALMGLHDYSRAALQLISHTGKRMQITDHLGMRILPSGELAATQGAHTIFGDGRIERSMLSAKLETVADQFAIPLPNDGVYGEWKSDVWPYIEERARRYVQFLQKYYGAPGLEQFQLAIMMGLASPFMPFVTGEFQSGSVLPRGGLSVSLYSRESARGKTTAVQSAILAYGKPAALTNDGGSLGATPKARVARLSMHGSLPNIMDEMGSASPEDVADAIHMVANGAAREKADRESGLNISAPWALINLITTNTSQRDMIAVVQESSDAIQRRLLEINVDGMPDHTHDLRHSFARDWAEINNQCVGAFGAIVHREICKLGLLKVTQLTMDCVERADKMTGAKVADRFQYRGLGAMLAMHVVVKAAGFEVFPIKGVVDAFKVAHDSTQDFIAQNVMSKNPLDVLAKLLHDLQPNTLITKSELRRTPGREEPPDQMMNARMPDVVQVRHVQDIGRSYVSVDALKAWCRKHGIAEGEITKRCRAEGIFKLHAGGRNSSEKYNLFKGLRENTGTYIMCYTIDRRKLAQKLGVADEMSLTAQEPAPASNVVPLR